MCDYHLSLLPAYSLALEMHIFFYLTYSEKVVIFIGFFYHLFSFRRCLGEGGGGS